MILARLAAISALLAGCNATPPQPTQQTQQAPTKAAAPAALSAEQAVGKKLQSTIRCLNQVSPILGSLIRGYRGATDAKTGPVEGRQLWIGRVDIKPCMTAAAEAAAVQPAAPELDAAFAGFAAALKAAAPLLEDAADYYEQKRNLDDKAARGRELHPRLLAAFDELRGREAALGKVVDKLDRARREARLVELAKDPARKADHARAKLALLAEDVLRLGDVGDPTEVDRAAFDGKLAALEAATKDVVALDVASSDWGFTNAARDYLGAALSVARRAREGKPLTPDEQRSAAGGSWTVEGSAAKLVHAYNDLIAASNRFH